MLPVLFHIALPAGFGLLAALAAALAMILGRAWLVRRAARREGEKLGWGAALADDRWTIAIAGVALALAWRSGALDGPIQLPLHTYGALIALAFIVGIALAQREAKRVGQDPARVADLAFYILLAALVGSRLYFIAVNWHDYSGDRFMADTALGRIPRVLALWEGGLVFYGGFIAAALAGAVYLRRHRMSFFAYADTLIPSLAFGHFLGRLGCFAAGCCWGRVAGGSFPWLVSFPPGSLAYQAFAAEPDAHAHLAAGGAGTLPLHPTQLYEAFGELGLFLALAFAIRPRKRFDGQVLASWLLGYSVLRAAIETFRGDVARGVVAGLGVGAWTSIAIFVTGVLVWVSARRSARSRLPVANAGG
jgi:phosphatidylglycerol:prolipoprotein diacylglycerol transferase